MNVSNLITFIKSIARLDKKDPQYKEKFDNHFIQNDLVDNAGTPAFGKLLQELNSIATEKQRESDKMKLMSGVDKKDYDSFLAHIGSPVHRYPEVEKLMRSVEAEAMAVPNAGTTTANVGAFPVPLGQESPGRKKHHESIQKLMGIGAYQLSEVKDADEEIRSLTLCDSKN